jgi:L-methionine (R)-S-oxide reductase
VKDIGPARQELLGHIRLAVEQPRPVDEKLKAVSQLLENGIPYYDWVGFYRVGGSDQVLLLGPYSGAPTRHVRIPFGQGVCGLAAEKRRPLMVPDVSRVVNYLSCSPKVKSEFVVPVFKDTQMVAELDVDSHTLDAFGEEDKDFLEAVAGMVAGLF